MNYLKTKWSNFCISILMFENKYFLKSYNIINSTTIDEIINLNQHNISYLNNLQYCVPTFYISWEVNIYHCKLDL